MKTVLCCLLLAFLVLALIPWFLPAANAQSTTVVSGIWTGELRAPSRPEIPFSLILTQIGSQISGRLTPNNGSTGAFQGVLESDALVFNVDFIYQGCSCSIQGSGITDGKALSLKYTGTDCMGQIQEGRLEAQKVANLRGLQNFILPASLPDVKSNLLAPSQAGATLRSFTITSSLLIVIAVLLLGGNTLWSRRTSGQESGSEEPAHES